MAAGSLALFTALALSVLALAVSILSLWLRQSPPEIRALQSQVQHIDADLSELADRQNTWMRREATRHARAGKADFAPGPAAPQSPAEKKAALRARVMAARSNGAA